jgi:phage terminase large subunit
VRKVLLALGALLMFEGASAWADADYHVQQQRMGYARLAVGIKDEIERELRRREMARSFRSLVMDRSHPLSALLYERADTKVFYGGRDAAKSWGGAEAMLRIANGSLGDASSLWGPGPHRFLCTREYQNSISDSIHRLLGDMTLRLGVDHRFKRTQTSLSNPYTGAEFLYKGLHHNINGIRSTEGVDICLVEEAQNVSDESWETLIPTIRKEGAELWVFFNVTDEQSPTYQRFVANPPPGAIVRMVNYDSNPFLSTRSKQAIEHLKLVDFDAYEHIYRGRAKRLSDAIIFGRNWREMDFDWVALSADAIRENGRIFYGMDHGFAHDPYAFIRFFILGRKLYISHEAFGRGVDFAGNMVDGRGELEQLADSVPGIREWPIKADNSRPETISFMCGKGYNCTAAEKWTGSVEDGIAHLKGYDEIIIHSRCKEMIQEARNYKYKVDQKTIDPRTNSPMVLPVVVDAFNHGWDAIRYGLDGHIQRSGDLATWSRLG